MGGPVPVSKRRNSYARRERDVPYMLWVKTQPCIITTLGVVRSEHAIRMTSAANLERYLKCYGEVEADHAGTRAVGRKAHDSTCIPCCRTHHDMKTNGWGLFWMLTLEEKRAWRVAAIEHTQAMAREQGVDPG